MKSFSGFLIGLKKLNEGFRDEFSIGEQAEVNGRQDSITFGGEIGTITSMSTQTARLRFDTRFSQHLHSGDGEDHTRCSYNIRYELLTPVIKDPNIRRIKLAMELRDALSTLKDDVYAKLLLALPKGVDKTIIVSDPIDFLKMEDDGTISYLKSRYFEECKGVEWSSGRRVKGKASRILREIYTPEYLSANLKETDVNAFVTKWAALTAPPKVEEFRGDDTMRAYNWKHELTKKFGHSCANFFQKELGGSYSDPTEAEFDIYTKNPKNCGAIVVWDRGEIVARRSFQQGPNLVDSGVFKKGVVGTVWGNYYGQGGSGAKYDRAIIDYLKKTYNAVDMYSNDGFIIKLEHTRFPRYCPFDSMYVCFEENLLANGTGCGLPDYRKLDWHDTYHAKCPPELLKKG